MVAETRGDPGTLRLGQLGRDKLEERPGSLEVAPSAPKEADLHPEMRNVLSQSAIPATPRNHKESKGLAVFSPFGQKTWPLTIQAFSSIYTGG